MALTDSSSLLGILANQYPIGHCSQNTRLCLNFKPHWSMQTLLSEDLTQTSSYSAYRHIFLTSHLYIVIFTHFHSHSRTCYLPDLHLIVPALTYADDHSTSRWLHTHTQQKLALQVYQEYNTKITTLLPMSKFKNYQSPNHSALRDSSYARKHLTWDCLIATQPQSLNVGAFVAYCSSYETMLGF